MIEILLNSKLWKLLTKQNRLFKMLNVETNSLAYSMILDDLLQNFSFGLGIDMDNNETPFGLYWKAVNLKAHQKNGQLTNLTRHMLNLHSADDMSKQNIYNFMNLIDMDDSAPYQIKNFILDFGKDRSTWNFRDQEGIMQVKHKYNAALDQAYMWGHVENDVIIDFWTHLENPQDDRRPNPASQSQNKPPELPQEPSRNEPTPQPPVLDDQIQRDDPLVKPEPPQRPEESFPKVNEPSEPKIEPEKKPEPEPEPIAVNPQMNFKMNNNPSQFPRKPSNTIKERGFDESGPPEFKGGARVTGSERAEQVDQQRADKQRNGLQDVFRDAGAESGRKI